MSTTQFLAYIALPLALIYSIAATCVSWLQTKEVRKEHDQRIDCRDRLIKTCRELKDIERAGEAVLKDNESLKGELESTSLVLGAANRTIKYHEDAIEKLGKFIGHPGCTSEHIVSEAVSQLGRAHTALTEIYEQCTGLRTRVNNPELQQEFIVFIREALVDTPAEIGRLHTSENTKGGTFVTDGIPKQDTTNHISDFS